MWEESWINLTMKMNDMPYYSYGKQEKVKSGTIEDLKNNFSKYIQK